MRLTKKREAEIRRMFSNDITDRGTGDLLEEIDALRGQVARLTSVRTLARSIIEARWSAEAGVYAEMGSGDNARTELARLQDDLGQLHVALDALDASDPLDEHVFTVAADVEGEVPAGTLMVLRPDGTVAPARRAP